MRHVSHTCKCLKKITSCSTARREFLGAILSRPIQSSVDLWSEKTEKQDWNSFSFEHALSPALGQISARGRGDKSLDQYLPSSETSSLPNIYSFFLWKGQGLSEKIVAKNLDFWALKTPKHVRTYSVKPKQIFFSLQLYLVLCLTISSHKNNGNPR